MSARPARALAVVQLAAPGSQMCSTILQTQGAWYSFIVNQPWDLWVV